MLNLMQSDLYKLKKSRYFLICLLLNLILAAGTIFLLDFTYKLMDDRIQTQIAEAQSTIETTGASLSADGIPKSYEELSASSQLLSFFSGENMILLAVVISLFVGNEFTYGTIKNLASRSYSRNKIFASKFIVSMLVSILFAVSYALTAAVTATYLWGFGTISQGFLTHLACGIVLELLLTAALTAIFLMFSILIRQNGGSLAANICFLELIPLAAMLGEILLKTLLNRTVSLSQYLIGSNMQAVATQPLSTGLVMRAICVAALFLIISAVVGALSFCRRDIR